MQSFTVVEGSSRYGEPVWKVTHEVATTRLATAATCNTKEQAEELARLLNNEANSLKSTAVPIPTVREVKWWEIWR